MDKYLVELGKVASDLEKLCGLGLVSSDGLPYVRLGIEDVTTHCEREAERLPKESLKALNTGIMRKVVPLSYLSCRMAYFGKKRLDYSEYPCMREIAMALLSFVKRKTLTEDALLQLNKVIIIISELDKRDKTMRCMLGYRFLRLFLIMVIYGSYCSASVVASFILEQFIIQEA